MKNSPLKLIGVCGQFLMAVRRYKLMRRDYATCDGKALGAIVVRRCPTLALVLVAGTLALADRNALASCGDYVRIGGPHQDGTDHSPAGMHDTPACSGPNCHRQLPPPPVPTPLMQTSSQEAACGTAGNEAQSDAHSAQDCDPVLLVSQAVILPPDRPPRASF